MPAVAVQGQAQVRVTTARREKRQLRRMTRARRDHLAGRLPARIGDGDRGVVGLAVVVRQDLHGDARRRAGGGVDRRRDAVPFGPVDPRVEGAQHHAHQSRVEALLVPHDGHDRAAAPERLELLSPVCEAVHASTPALQASGAACPS